MTMPRPCENCGHVRARKPSRMQPVIPVGTRFGQRVVISGPESRVVKQDGATATCYQVRCDCGVEGWILRGNLARYERCQKCAQKLRRAGNGPRRTA